MGYVVKCGRLVWNYYQSNGLKAAIRGAHDMAKVNFGLRRPNILVVDESDQTVVYRLA
jgi:hypothetical protein